MRYHNLKIEEGIEWTDNPSDLDPLYDLCGKFNGKYVDIIRSDVTGYWGVMYDNNEFKNNNGNELKFKNRDAAQGWVEQKLST